MMMSVDYNVNVFSIHVLLYGDDSYPLAGGKCLTTPSLTASDETFEIFCLRHIALVEYNFVMRWAIV